MSNWYSGSWHCPRCEIVIEQLIERERRYEPIVCEDCGGLAGPCVAAPMVLTASRPDGLSAGDGHKKLAEAAALEVDMYDRPPDKREDIAKEIRKLKSLKPETVK